MANNNEQPSPGLELIRASEVQPREIDWLWYPFIPYGKVTLLQGDPGDGKSTFILTIAALLTRGKPLPFTEQDEAGEPLTVFYHQAKTEMRELAVHRENLKRILSIAPSNEQEREQSKSEPATLQNEK